MTNDANPIDMKIATWNVRRADHTDVAHVLARLDADVVVLQEIAAPEAAVPLFGASDVRSVGTDERTRLAVFTFGEFRFGAEPAVAWDPTTELLWALPVQVEGPTPLRLLAVWADNSEPAVRPATEAVRHLAGGWPGTGPTVVAGDFNHHRKWDHKRDNASDHKVTVELLTGLGLVSAYHRAEGLEELPASREDHPTFWMYGHADKPHHIDYIYAPGESVQPDGVAVGGFDDIVAAGLSDHAPVSAKLTF